MSIEAPLLARLNDAQGASCTCVTKTPDIQYHAPLCHFRLFVEAAEYIAHLESCSTNEIYAARLGELQDAANVADSLLASRDEAIKAFEHQINLAFSLLEVYGVPRERARTVHNGIEVLAARYHKLDFAYEALLKRVAEFEAKDKERHE